MSEFTHLSLPHFFKYAKDKDDKQIDDLNESFVNKLESIIPNPRMSFKKLGLGEIDYELMMKIPDIDVSDDNPVVVEYRKLNKECYITVDALLGMYKISSTNVDMKSIDKYRKIMRDIKSSLSRFGYDDEEIVDILVKYLYGMRKSGNKTALWLCYGDIILKNMEEQLKYQTKVVECVDCGKWIAVSKHDDSTCRCTTCQKEHSRILARERKRKSRLKQMSR